MGVDNLNSYYDPALKKARLDLLKKHIKFSFFQQDIADYETLSSLPRKNEIERVVHLAAQAGVRYSLENPFAYAQSNLVGHLSVLEFCRHAPQKPVLIYASSSSVYGDNAFPPFHEDADIHEPVSLYAATKAADELMSTSYAHLFRLEQIGLRFFTVYGPWGRPDMAYWLFTDKILRGEEISVFNHGRLKRDFTFIDDIIEGILSILTTKPDWTGYRRPHKIYNLGNHQPVELLYFIETLEDVLQSQAKKIFKPMQAGDVHETCAAMDKMMRDYEFIPKTSLKSGLKHFVEWYKDYHKISS